MPSIPERSWDYRQMFPSEISVLEKPRHLNGSWSPLYSWHKLMAGLLDANRYCGNVAAVQAAEKLGA